MTATNHALTGAVIALAVKNPALSIPLALLSHLAIDVIPHFDMGAGKAGRFMRIVLIDSLIAACLTLILPFLLSSHRATWPIFACMFVAISPDLIWGWRYFRFKDLSRVLTERMSFFSSLHKRIQWSETPKGWVVEFAWFCLAVCSIVKLPS